MRASLRIVALTILFAALSACEGRSSANEPTQPPAGQGGSDEGTVLEITAKNLHFDKNKLVAPANTKVTVVFHNRDQGAQHNFAAYRSSDAKESIFKRELVTGVMTHRYEFTTPGPGTYFFRCDVHPDTMTGTFVTE